MADLTRDEQVQAAEEASKILIRSEDMQATRVIDCGRIVEELKRIDRASKSM